MFAEEAAETAGYLPLCIEAAQLVRLPPDNAAPVAVVVVMLELEAEEAAVALQEPAEAA